MGYLNNTTAFPDENQIMKYKLITLPRGTAKLPVLELGFTTINMKQGSSLSITPQTLNYLGTDSTFEASGYVATIGDSRTLSTFEGVGVNNADAATLNSTSTIGTNVSRTVLGTTINLAATTVNTLFGTSNTLNTILTLTGRDSGARLTVPLNITRITS